MKNELTIEHLAAYLPYGLQVKHTTFMDYSEPIERTEALQGIYEDCCTFKNGCDWYFDDEENECEIKPLLLPLSKFGDSDDVRKVHEYIGLGKWCEAYDHYFKIWFDDLANIDKLVLQAPYEIFRYFLANHYDVFGLIEKGLAIDKTTVSL